MLISLILREPPISLRCLLGVPWLHPPGVPPTRDDGVPNTRGELISISELGSGKLVGGEEMRWAAGLEGSWDVTRLREVGGAWLSVVGGDRTPPAVSLEGGAKEKSISTCSKI